jgi:HPt (histidine-containing phosphotransfer) domain-containing protein
MGNKGQALDVQHLSVQAGGDPALMAQVLELFLEHAAQVLEALAAAGDAKAWHDHAHALKGSAKGVGAWAVAEAALAAEQEPLNYQRIAPLRSAFAEARAAIGAFRAQQAA